MNERFKNPFTPIFGKVPAYMAGRTQLIDDMAQALHSDGNDPALVSIFVGARGAGKTALLSLFANMAEQDGWVSARVTAAPGMLDEIPLRINRSASHIIESAPKRRLSSINIGPIGALSWDNTEIAVTSWRTRMDDVLDQLDEAGVGLIITVDEVDPDLEEMTTLVTAFQHFLDEGRRVALLMAGLPYGLTSLLAGKTTSFLRRAARHDLVSLSNYEVEEAFRITLEKGGKSIGDEALLRAVDAIGGFPYMFQLVGYRAWNLAVDREEVTAEDVRVATGIAQQELEDRVYEATYYELTEADRAFLRAMLEDDIITRQSVLPERLGRATGHISRYKKRMLKQGIIRERTKGQLEFCLPGFREFFATREAEMGNLVLPRLPER